VTTLRTIAGARGAAGELLGAQLGQLGTVLEAVARDAAAAAAAQVLDEVRSILAEASAIVLRPPAGPAAKEEMTTADVCELFSIDKKTLWTWRRQESHPFPAPYKCGDNTLRYLRSDVNTWRASREVVDLRRARPLAIATGERRAR
jgi:predicted DNA-binding transcriptional regulator AlpA